MTLFPPTLVITRIWTKIILILNVPKCLPLYRIVNTYCVLLCAYRNTYRIGGFLVSTQPYYQPMYQLNWGQGSRRCNNCMLAVYSPGAAASTHRATSVDEGLYQAHMELTPSKKKGSVFGSLEKMFNMLTPKKQRSSSTEGPRKVKVGVFKLSILVA